MTTIATPVHAGRYAGPTDWKDMKEFAQAIAEGDRTLPDLYRGNPGNVLNAMMAAQALDIAIPTAMAHVVYGENGQGGMRGQLMLALIQRAGHKLTKIHHDDTRAEYRLTRADGLADETAEWTIQEAQRANLADLESWRFYPDDMLFWRCVARLARRTCSDAVLGFGYLPDELAAMSAAGHTVDVPAQREVPAEVQEFLADAGDLDEAGLRAKLKLAVKRGLEDEFAGVVGGVEYTVAQLLHVFVDRRLTAQEQFDLAQVRNDAAPDLDLSEDLSVDVADQADDRVLFCGCNAQQVLMDGEHGPGCKDRRPVDAELVNV